MTTQCNNLRAEAANLSAADRSMHKRLEPDQPEWDLMATLDRNEAFAAAVLAVSDRAFKHGYAKGWRVALKQERFERRVLPPIVGFVVGAILGAAFIVWGA